MDEKVAKLMETLEKGNRFEGLEAALQAQQEAEDKVCERTSHSIIAAAGEVEAKTCRFNTHIHTHSSITTHTHTPSLHLQARQKWLLENMSNEDEGRWRCAADGCTKLFKSSEFLQKHLLLKHVQGLDDSLRVVSKEKERMRVYVYVSWLPFACACACAFIYFDFNSPPSSFLSPPIFSLASPGVYSQVL